MFWTPEIPFKTVFTVINTRQGGIQCHAIHTGFYKNLSVYVYNVDICKVIPEEMLHFSEDLCVSTALKLKGMELCSGIISVNLLFRYKRNSGREIKQISQKLEFQRKYVYGISPTRVGSMCYIHRERYHLRNK
jgi:hypothetical protein